VGSNITITGMTSSIATGMSHKKLKDDAEEKPDDFGNTKMD
jgi:hypothetical protein